MAIPGILVFMAILINFARTPIKTVDGLVIGETENWTLKHSYRCYVAVETEVGKVTQFYDGRCARRWRTGDQVVMRVRVGRVVPQVIGGIVGGARHSELQPKPQ